LQGSASTVRDIEGVGAGKKASSDLDERRSGLNSFLFHFVLNFLVEEGDHSGESTSHDIGEHTLVKTLGAFFLDDDLGAIESTLVESLLEGLLRLHLEATTDGVEGVVEGSGDDTGSLGGEESSYESHDSDILLPGVESHDGIEETELETTVDDNTGNGGTETVVDGSGSLLGGGLAEAIEDTVEGLFFTTDIGSETGSGEIEGVADGEGESCSETSRGEVNSEETPEVLFSIIFGELLLDGILERQVEGLLGEVSYDIGTVSSPEGVETLLGTDSVEAVNHTVVSSNFSRDNFRVGILSLD